MKNPLILIIADGYGIAPSGKGNAIALAGGGLSDIFERYPTTSLRCSGMDVGLPEGQMGNSEVGHTNIGAGRVVYQDLTHITREIENGNFFNNAALISAMENCKNNSKKLHLIGLLSDGGVHSHQNHLWALLKMAKKFGLERVYIHAFLDGRDTPPRSALNFVKQMSEKTAELGIGKIATVSGRYYAMDRDKRWERIEKAYDAMVCGEGNFNSDAVKAVELSYENDISDEFFVPTVCDKDGMIEDGDSVIAFNFRPDRMRQITAAFTQPYFNGFDRKKVLKNLNYVCFTQYDASFSGVSIAFSPASVNNNLGEYLSSLGYKQLRIAETEKYAHVTFFFNGGVEKQYNGEERILVPSPKVATYDLAPEMSARQITEKVCAAVSDGKFDVIIVNYANCDMVGHTGSIPACVAAVRTVSECIEKVVAENNKAGGITIITADHGNAEKMLDDDGKTPFTAHTTNPVPLCVIGADVKLKNGRLADIAPTILDLMGIEKPPEMDGASLIIK